MKKLFCIVSLLGFIPLVNAQYENSHHSEIGVSIQAMSASNHGGTIGGALKYAYVIDDQIVFGPTFRLQYAWSNNLTYGDKTKNFTYGGGAYFHVRFLDWFYLGADFEMLKNPFTYINKDKKWSAVGLLGGGIARSFGPVLLSAGIMYDVIDALRDPYKSNPSPLSGGYFLRVKNPKKPNNGKYIPLLYRITLFIPLGGKD